jgi:2-dehydro-3-deoxyphosphogalactonate aldolase
MNDSVELLKNLKSAPVIAILRGVTPDKVMAIADQLVLAGVNVIEVPLNSPDPFKSIQLLRSELGPEIIVGAGTVLTVKDVEAIAKAGAQICISPNLDLDVVAAAHKNHLVSIPGIATSSEFFQAYKNDVRIMKLFPFSNLGIPFMKSLQSVSPTDACLVPVGGVHIEDTFELVQAGALAVGIGNSLYGPKISKEEFIERCSSVAKVISQFA